MKQKHLFAGIFIEKSNAFAAVIDPEGKAILCGQYQYTLPEEDLQEIIDHLSHLADMQRACLHIALAQRWDEPTLPMDLITPDDGELLCLNHRNLEQTGLARFSCQSDTCYDKAKLLALLRALRYATAYKDSELFFVDKNAA